MFLKAMFDKSTFHVATGGSLFGKVKLAALFLSLMMVAVTTTAARADFLKGGVSEENLRLNHGGSGRPLNGRADGSGLRISRAPAALQGSAVDSGAFAGTPMTAKASPLNGVVDDNDFAKPPKNFDIGAERNSREMVLAWERWHKQLSQAIYERWQRIARDPGKATIRVTVTRDHHITAQVINFKGAPQFESTILDAIASLDGNPGLTFPSESQRQEVHFDADYIAAADVQPGFSWVKNDYEKIHQDY